MAAWLNKLIEASRFAALTMITLTVLPDSAPAANRVGRVASCLAQLSGLSGLWNDEVIHRNGTRAVYRRRGFLGLGETVEVVRNDGLSPASVSYKLTTHRDAAYLLRHNYYPRSTLSYEALRNERVLDVGVGGGRFVEDLIRHGINARGIDVYLKKSLRKKPHFIQADVLETGFAEGSFSVIFATQTLFSYETENRTRRTRGLIEMARILEPGGRLLISPWTVVEVDHTGKKNEVKFTYEELEELLLAVPTLRVKEKAGRSWFGFLGLGAPSWIELEKI